MRLTRAKMQWQMETACAGLLNRETKSVHGLTCRALNTNRTSPSTSKHLQESLRAEKQPTHALLTDDCVAVGET
ncbi:hypothetical protein JOB18_031512 [Solea senegalensis]|uniref:Uncharacterized protein n=1 Tax=Solea senegalensis TaxID=28829 RepID=A0AAV6SU35_SOLSE|nr:hypothetical protein JOB18_031512 [Solea senegalensis]